LGIAESPAEGRPVSGHWSDVEADYDTRPGPPGWLDRLFASDSVTSVFFLLMLSGCCPVAPFAGLMSGLGLLVCRTPEARLNAAFLLVAATGHAVFFWVVAAHVVLL
jgi:hypothetical protein